MNQTISEFGFLATSEKTSLIYKKLREELDEAKFLRMFSRDVHNNSARMFYTSQNAHYGFVRAQEVWKVLDNPSEYNYSDFSNIMF